MIENITLFSRDGEPAGMKTGVHSAGTYLSDEGPKEEEVEVVELDEPMTHAESLNGENYPQRIRDFFDIGE